MAYDQDITEGIPYTLSNPAGSTTYTPTGPAYDVAFSALPFFIAASDEQPYRRVTAQYRKQQVDQSREPGEQTLTGWWVRSQSSFHFGAGIKYFEPIQEESLRFQYTESKGLDIWTKGQATLLNDTASFYAGAAAAQLIGVNDGTDDCILVTDGTALKKITSAGVSSTYTQAGTPDTIFSLTTNGKQYFFINGTHVHRGNLAGTTSDTEIYNASSTTRATIRYVKQRLIAAIGSAIYELDANNASGALPAALYTHPNSSWVWSSIAEGPQAIYISGYDSNGTSSSVFKIALDPTTSNSLGFPTLETPTVIIDMPQGERINDFDVYLGVYAVLATNLGFRVGIANTTGDIQYGPLLFRDAECNSIAFRDSYAYLATKVDGEAGLVRVDLSSTVIDNSLYFPWAWDLVATATTTTASQVAFFGNSDRAAFTNGNNTWAESTTSLVATGYLRTGYIRYNTLETKIYKLMQARIDTTNGGITIDSIDSTDTEYRIGTFSQGEIVPEINVNYPTTAQEYLGFGFTLIRSTTDVTKGPLFTGYQLKSLPAVPRQRLIQYPVFCYDHESDKFGNEIGYEGSAYERMSQLEAVENAGDTIRIQDLRIGESYLGIIEEMDFMNKTPEDKRFSGFGGTLLVTIRTV
tara:strand:+ start:909 stop:2816 length:1908 start_codon:yes stop_codon:yes gene_type:complete